MLDLIISGKTRLKLLLKFFLAPEISGHLRGLAEEFGESTNSIRLELNRFEQGGLLLSCMEQNRKVFRANKNHPLFSDLTAILRKHVGLDHLVEEHLDRIGNVTHAYLTGDMAVGRDSKCIELLLVGEEINMENLQRLTAKVEKLINRKIHTIILTSAEAKNQIVGKKDNWKIWGN
ncbi:MAG: ArsR family transcriptional regulator [Bacteroidetes bacterium]|nr:ArsR family transcriptional regulator [Bacteroidota bacterium]